MSLALLLSLVALLVGPVVYARARSGLAASAVDAFALVGVAGLVFAHILPQSMASAGWWVVPVALVGLFGPGLLCGSRFFAGKSSARITMPLALLGIALHAMLDGVALAGAGSDHAHGGDHLLPVAVVLHRIPVGLGIWWLARPLYGQRAAGGLIATIALFTVLGFGFAPSLLGGTSEGWFALFQALIAGSLLHVVFRHPPSVPKSVPGGSAGESSEEHGATAQASAGSRRIASGLGGLLGIGLVIALESFHLEDDMVGAAARVTFLDLALQSAPALFFAYVAVALVHAQELDLARLLGRGRPFGQSLRGTFAGLPIPICSCGVIPLYRSLIQQRVPVPAAMSFLVATPELGIAAIFLSWSLLGGPLTLVRAGCAIALALLAGLVVGRRAPVISSEVPPVVTSHAKAPWGTRLRGGLVYGFGDMLDGTAPWILVGLALAAIVDPFVQADGIANVPGFLEVPLFALAGMPLYVCASGSTPLVAILLAKGVSPGAAIAFLLTGPATNLTTFGVLGRLHGRRTALAFASVVIAATILLGYGVNFGFTDVAAGLPVLDEEHSGGVLEWGSLVALVLAFGASFLRQGTRGFLGQVISPHGDEHAHDHDHDHDHAHACCTDDVPGHALKGEPTSPPAHS